MKIGILSFYYLETTFPLARNLAERGNEVTLICLFNIENRNSYVVDYSKFDVRSGFDNRYNALALNDQLKNYLGRINLHTFFYPNYKKAPFRTLLNQLELSWFLAKQHFDIIHLIGETPFYYLLHLLFSESKVIHTMHESTSHETLNNSFFQEKLLNYLGRSKNELIFHSTATRDRFIAYCNQKHLLNQHLYNRSNVIPFGLFETYRFFTEKDINTFQCAENTILFFGRITPYKGLNYLIKASIQAKKTIPDLKVIIAGEGEIGGERLDHNLFDIINKTLSNAELVEQIQRSKIIVCPYVSASQSGIPMVAFLFGKPVIASDVGAFREIIEDGETGLLVPPADETELTNAITKILNEPGIIQKMQNNIYERFSVNASHSWDEPGQKTLAVYKKALKNPVESILYCSSLCSERLIEYLYETSTPKPLNSIQKYHRLLSKGLETNNIVVTTISAIPVNPASNKRMLWKEKCETEEGVHYQYAPFININYIRQAMIAVNAFAACVLWCIKNRKHSNIIIVDVLNVSVAVSVKLAARLFRVKTCAVVTDLPDMLHQISEHEKLTFLGKWARRISTRLLTSYDGYVLLTDHMNMKVNRFNKPHVIIEGLVDKAMEQRTNSLRNKHVPLTILYTGGLYEKYGIKRLIEAFMNIHHDNLELHLYGDGDMTSELAGYIQADQRIRYFGVVNNSHIVEQQLKATLLVNPRPSNEEFTKYSFPSKNMEYMVSGTPVVTTALPGMPGEYYDYVYIFRDEETTGIAQTLQHLLTQPQQKLHDYGMNARQFVLKNKNHLVQAEKLLKMLNTL